MKMTRPCIHALLLAICLLLIITSVSFGEQFNWRKYEGTTLRMLASKSAFTPINKKMIAKFEAVTGITVKAEHYGSTQLRKKLTMELGARNKDLDVFAGMMKTNYQYDAGGWLEPLEKYLNDPSLTSPDYDYADFFPRLEARINDRIIGVTTSCNPQVFMYRKDLFEKYNIKVPTNWEELENAAKILKENLPKGQFAWVARMNVENTAPFAPYLYSNGGSWLDKNGRPGFNSKEAVEAFEFYGKMAREYGPPGASTIGWKEVIGAMAQGKAAMTSEISIFATLVLENPKKSKVVGKMGYAMVPAGKPGNFVNVVPLNTNHISALSEKKEAAWMLIQFLTMKEQLLPFKLVGLPTTRQSNWQNPKWKEKDRLPALSELQVKAIESGMVGFEIPIPQFTAARPVLSRLIYTPYEQGDVQKAADDTVKEIERMMTD